MLYYDENSYDSYRQYRLNRYRYEQDMWMLPLGIIIAGAILNFIWPYILIGAIVVSVVVLAFFFWRKRKPGKMRSAQPLVLTPEEALRGVNINAEIANIGKPMTIRIHIPPNTKSGQKYIAKNVEIENQSGKKQTVDILFEIIVE